MLNVARQVRPKLYVVADLVTNSDEEENYFVNRLRINSVIKGELYMLNSMMLFSYQLLSTYMYSARVCVYICISSIY